MNTRRRCVRGTLIAAGVLLLGAGCWGKGDTGAISGGLSGDSSADNCGFDLAPEGPVTVDACLDGPGVTTLFGPESFTRATGAPVTVTRSFDVAAAGTFCIKVVNGDGTNHTANASATISIDGNDVIGPNRFNPNVPVVTARPTVDVGTHSLAVTVKSKPGSFIAVEVRFAAEGGAPRDVVAGGAGHLEISNLFDEADPFSPGNADGVHDTVTLGVTASPLKTRLGRW